jgi:NAD(P)-dependent dehydrogenase (short-subunit alcohol dehydrogenase family)
MDALLDFSSKVVLITGAAQGFGKGLAEELAKRGALLVIGDVKEEAVNRVAAAIDASGERIIAMKCDVSQQTECKAMVDAAVEKFGRLDIAVNNAGIAPPMAPLHMTTEEMMDSQFNINVKGVQFGMRFQIEHMLKQGSGTILNVSSMAGIGGAPLVASYAAAKHAVIGLTKTGAVEYASKNIRINAICPFFTLTNMVTDMADEDLQSTFARRAPIKRLAAPEEVVNTMVLMLSPSNTYMTGQCIAVDGAVSAM